MIESQALILQGGRSRHSLLKHLGSELKNKLWRSHPDLLQYMCACGLWGVGNKVSQAEGLPTLNTWANPFTVDADASIVPPERCVRHPADQVAWYKNADGEGTFEVGRDISTTSDGAQRMAVADFSGDGNLDIMLASVADRVEWFKNSDGVFSLGVELEEQTTAVGAM